MDKIDDQTRVIYLARRSRVLIVFLAMKSSGNDHAKLFSVPTNAKAPMPKQGSI